MADGPQEIVLVTGASRGIGRHLVDHFLERGDVVIGCSRGAMERELPNYRHFALDVTDEAAVRRVVAAIRKDHGRLDVVINNAGVASMNHVLLMPTETARKVLDVNVLGTFVVCREAARLMQRNRYGRIVNIGSIAGALRIAGEAMYAASKAAVVSFTEVVAHELAPFNITCNVIAVAPIRTDLIKGVSENKISRLVDRLAVKRLGRFEDVTNVADFFVSRASDYVTGQTIYLGGP